MEPTTEILLAEIRRLGLLVQALTSRNELLEQHLRTAPRPLPAGADGHTQHLSMPVFPEDGHKHPFGMPVPASEGHIPDLLMPMYPADGHTQQMFMPAQFADRNTQPARMPIQDEDRHTQPLPMPIYGAHRQAEGGSVPPGRTLAPQPVRAVAPSPPAAPLPGCAELVRVLKKNGMGRTKNSGVFRAARVLLLVAEGGRPISMKRLCAELGLSTDGAAKLLASLRRRGWLLRTGTYGLRLTPEANGLLARALRPSPPPSE